MPETEARALGEADQTRLLTAIEASIAEGTDCDVEIRALTPDGEIRGISISAQPADDVNSTPFRLSGISLDVTAQKQKENALRQLNEMLEKRVAERTATLQANEARLRAIIETSDQFQGLMSVDGVLVEANGVSLESIGARLDEVVGLSFAETPWFAGTPGVPDRIRAALALVAKGQTVRHELRLNLPVGGWRWFDFTLRPIRDPSGTVMALVLEAAEFTARRHTEEALRQAQKMEAIGHLTGGIAHDFNNLLTGISGSLELVRQRIGSGRTDGLGRFIDIASSSAQRAAALTHRLLAFARRQALDVQSQNINALVGGLDEMLRLLLGERIIVETILAVDLWPAMTDANQLESALLNLAINARDAMPEGGHLTTETANARLDAAYAAKNEDVRPGDYVVIAVSDTGAGMTPDVLARAFDPFFTTKPIGQGTGLGLSMIYGFARQSGSHVRLYSELGRGTTVKIYLPRATVAAEAPETVPGAEPRQGRGEPVPAVEDDDAVRIPPSRLCRASATGTWMRRMPERSYDSCHPEARSKHCSPAALPRMPRSRAVSWRL